MVKSLSSYEGPNRGYKDTKVDLEFERHHTHRPEETQIDITERDYRRRTDPSYQVEYEHERVRPHEEIKIERKQFVEHEGSHHRDDMGYYDDEGRYHSFRRGVERAADRVLHPLSGGDRHRDHYDREEVIIKEEGGHAPRERVRETVRYVESGAARSGGRGSANTVTIPCHFIRTGDLVILQGRPCQIIRISTSPQTGQHRYLGIDLFTRQLHEDQSLISNPSPSVVVQTMLGPVFKQYRILDISDDGYLTAITETGDVKSDLPVIEQGGLFGKISRAFSDGRGGVRALVVNDGRAELTVDYKVVHGSRL